MTVARPGIFAQLALAGGAVGVIALGIAWAGDPPAAAPMPPVWSGRVGPPALAVAVKPAAAGAAAQTVTLTFTRPRSGAPYDVLASVRARLTPKALATSPPGIAPGGPAKATKAVETAPGVWTITLAGDEHVALPGAWTLRVSASPRPGQSFKQDIPLTFT